MEFEKVFSEDQLEEFPSKRVVDHATELVEDINPVSRPLYHMTSEELDELRQQFG